MADTSTQSIQVHAPLAQVAAVICDFPRYPEWADAMKQVEVLEEYEDGYAAQVRFVIDAGPLADDYTLDYAYAEDLSRIEWHLVAPSKMQRTLNGSYDLADNGDGTTTVTYMKLLGAFRLRKRCRSNRAASVMAAGSVMNEPSSGPTERSVK